MKLAWVDSTFVYDDEGYGPRFIVQTEHVRFEPTCHYLLLRDPADENIRDKHHIETTFVGRGGRAKVRAAAQQIEDIRVS